MLPVLLDAILRPLLLLALAVCAPTCIAILHDTLTTAYSEPED